MTDHSSDGSVLADAMKAVLVRYLQSARDAVIWKLTGLDEYAVRRPMTPTGTNLLGLVKHLAAVEAGYFGATFGRPFTEPSPWDEESEDPNADLWATEDESREEILALYDRARQHADATISALPLDARGTVPWWPGERAQVTLHVVLVHVLAEVNRHAGHADIVRESLDDSAGLRATGDNLWVPADGWAGHRARVEAAAQHVRDRTG